MVTTPAPPPPRAAKDIGAFAVAREGVLAALDRMYEAGDSDGIAAAAIAAIDGINTAQSAAAASAGIAAAAIAAAREAAIAAAVEIADELLRSDATKALLDDVFDALDAAGLDPEGTGDHMVVNELIFAAACRGSISAIDAADAADVQDIGVVNALDAAALQAMHLGTQALAAILKARANYAARPATG